MPTVPFPKLKFKSADEVQTAVAFAEMLAATDRLATLTGIPQDTGRQFREWMTAMKKGHEQKAVDAAPGARAELASHASGPEVSRVIELIGEYIETITNPAGAEVKAIIEKLAAMGFDVRPHKADAAIR